MCQVRIYTTGLWSFFQSMCQVRIYTTGLWSFFQSCVRCVSTQLDYGHSSKAVSGAYLHNWTMVILPKHVSGAYLHNWTMVILPKLCQVRIYTTGLWSFFQSCVRCVSTQLDYGHSSKACVRCVSTQLDYGHSSKAVSGAYLHNWTMVILPKLCQVRIYTTGLWSFFQSCVRCVSTQLDYGHSSKAELHTPWSITAIRNL